MKRLVPFHRVVLLPLVFGAILGLVMPQPVLSQFCETYVNNKGIRQSYSCTFGCGDKKCETDTCYGSCYGNGHCKFCIDILYCGDIQFTCCWQWSCT